METEISLIEYLKHFDENLNDVPGLCEISVYEGCPIADISRKGKLGICMIFDSEPFDLGTELEIPKKRVLQWADEICIKLKQIFKCNFEFVDAGFPFHYCAGFKAVEDKTAENLIPFTYDFKTKGFKFEVHKRY
jgi:hypothetical protein